MTVITKLRRQWFHKQGRFMPEDVEAVLRCDTPLANATEKPKPSGAPA